MSTPQIVAGYDTELTVLLLKEDGSPDNVTGASALLIGLADRKRSGIAIGPYTAAANHAGADWSQGKVVVTVPGADTAGKAGQVVFADAKATVGTAIRAYFADNLMQIMPGNL